MPWGPGKYGEFLAAALIECKAREGLLIVLDGSKGPGFACQTCARNLPNIAMVLRHVADELDRNGDTMVEA
jgi:hypothetical protein